MEKTKSILRKIMLLFFSVILFFTISGILTSSTNASDADALHAKNTDLIRENIEMKNEYGKLISRLGKLETNLKKIKEYDNIIYSQILGVDFDTTQYHLFVNDSSDLVNEEFDRIFSEVNERAFYAAEMLSTQLLKLQQTATLFKRDKNAIFNYPTLSPIRTKDFINLSSPYGWRIDPFTKKSIFHEGVDISAKPGTPVYSTAQGKIVKILYSKYGYGNRIVIAHKYGFETLYAHLNVISVKRGQWVRKNQLIGTVGTTGRSTAPHLHYEIKKNNEPRDPLGYFYTHITNDLLVSK